MAHPLRSETNASQAAKLRAMTENYGGADPKANVRPGVEKYKGEGLEEDVGFGADNSKPKLHGARVSRMTKPTNPYATYKKGGRVKGRDSGGGVSDLGDIESADIDQKLSSHKRGGRIKHRAAGGSSTAATTGSSASSPLSSAGSTTNSSSPVTNGSQQAQYLADIGQSRRGGRVKATHRAKGGRVRGEEGPFETYPKPVKGGGKYATVSSEPSPTPVDNRARGGRTGGHKDKKGGTHVNIMIAPQHGQPGAGAMPPVSAMPTPPPMPRPPMAPPGGVSGGAMPPPGAMPPGAMPGGPGMMPPPGAMPPEIMPPRKRGGRIVANEKHSDEAQDLSLIRRTVKADALKPRGSMRAAGGRMTAGAATGEGRLEKAEIQKRSGKMHAQEV